MVSVPRVVVAAPASGAGKTSIATGLLAALRARGLTVSPHKVGPDYIDPGYHALAAGRVGRNLDPWLVGEPRVAPLFLRGALHPVRADVAVIEGVMGLFDGLAAGAGFASTAHVATLLAAPVVLVVDATAVGRSVAATVHGFRTFDPAVRIGGVVFNRVGSPRHAEILRAAMAELGLPVLGMVARHDRLVTPSRHLGLVPAAERSAQATSTVAELGAVIGRSVDLDAVLALARTAPDLAAPPWDPAAALAPAPAPVARPVVAIAGGPAFTFGYAETPELLAAAGAEVARFDPAHDETLPPGTAALVIGGGFPQVHAGALAANTRLRAQVAALARSGAPIVAECAGLLYLTGSLDGAPMCGVLDATSAMTPRLTMGYREAVARADSVLAPAGTVVRGHEFHRTATTPPAGAQAAWRWRDGTGEQVDEGFVQGGVHASYLHTHWAGRPEAAARLVAAARTASGAARAAIDAAARDVGSDVGVSS
jgi:cobyrinic acid a,c-diamide synthase